MTHLVVVNYLLASNSLKMLRQITNRWLTIMILSTVIHWAISQYWLSSMTVADHRKWLNVIQCAVNLNWFKVHGDEFISVAVLRAIATIDSFVYRMYIYGSRVSSMCAYCLLSTLLTECIIQVNRILTDYLDNEYHFHHHYCQKARKTTTKRMQNKYNVDVVDSSRNGSSNANRNNSNDDCCCGTQSCFGRSHNIASVRPVASIRTTTITMPSSSLHNHNHHYPHHYNNRHRHRPNCSVQFNLPLFKDKFNIVYRMHQEIEQCFGPLNFVWFGSLFVVSCIDIFFLAWKAGTEWFRVWSLLEFTSMIVLWIPHIFVAYHASRVSIESRRMKLHLKELCRDDEEVRDILVSSMFYPRMKPTLYGVVQLDIGFMLSFICTLATFSVMLIQLNPDAASKFG